MFPPAIKFLLISNVAVFLFQLTLGNLHSGDGATINDYILRYGALWPLGGQDFFGSLFKIWQPITYMFLHGGWTHILFNMFALWMFGVEVENTWGTKKFLIYYTACGLGGAASHLIMGQVLGISTGPLIGASGAIFGVLVAFGMLFPDHRVYFWPLIFIGIPARIFVGLYIVIEILSVGGNDNVGHLAHLGGAVTGIIYLLIASGGQSFRTRSPRRPSPSDWRRQSNNPPPRKQTSFWGAKPPKNAPDNAIDAEFSDLSPNAGPTKSNQQPNVHQGRVITQEEIDRILDKIAASGYNNLSNEERDILFEASKRME